MKECVSKGRSSPTTIYQLVMILAIITATIAPAQAQDTSDVGGGLAFQALLHGPNDEPTFVIEVPAPEGHRVLDAYKVDGEVRYAPSPAISRHVVTLLNMSTQRRQYLLKIPTGWTVTIEGVTYPVYRVEVNWRDTRVSRFIVTFARADQVLAAEIDKLRTRVSQLELDRDDHNQDLETLFAFANAQLRAEGKDPLEREKKRTYTPPTSPEITLSGTPTPPATKPPATAPVEQKPFTINGTINADRTVSFTGTGTVGSTVEIDINTVDTYEAVVDSAGTWSYQTAPIAVGTYTYSAEQKDAGSGRVTRPASGTLRIAAAAAAPATSHVTIDIPADGTSVTAGRVEIRGKSTNPAVQRVTIYLDTVEVTKLDVKGGVWGARPKLTTAGTFPLKVVGTDNDNNPVAGEESAITITVK